MSVSFCFNIKNDTGWNPNTIFYYNGSINDVQPVHNPEEYKYLQSVYKETTGRDLITYWWTSSAPVYTRIFGVLRPGSQIAEYNGRLLALKQLSDEYMEVYGDPKFFTPMTVLKIVNKPGPEGYVIGYSTIGIKYEVLDAITQCDYDWAKIKFNGQDAWIAMGDVLGDEYGIRSKT